MKKASRKKPDITRILSVPISAVNMDMALQIIEGWIEAKKSAFICVRDVHGVMRAIKDAKLMDMHEKAGLVTPDGMPLVKISQWRGKAYVGRVAGADLMDALCALSAKKGWRNYFYGGAKGVAEKLAHNMQKKYPGFRVAGITMPPFRRLTKKEDDKVTQAIKSSRAKIVWVGLSTPKQEAWMASHTGRIPGAVLIGVGAAFDFHAGTVKRAPQWMQKSGLEWLHRLFSDPKRLWRRYLVLAPHFIFLVLLESMGLRRR